MSKRENMSSSYNDARVLRRCSSGFDWNTVNTNESFYFGDNNEVSFKYDGTNFLQSGNMKYSTAPTGYLTPTLAVGNYSTPVVDAILTDNIAFLVSISTATNKTDADTSTMAAFVACKNTASTPHNKLQGLLASTTVGGNCFDAYAVQGHLSITASMSTHDSIAHVTGGSFKANIATGVTVSQGSVTAGLFLVTGDGAVTENCHGIWVYTYPEVTAVTDLIRVSAGGAITNAFRVDGCANLTNFVKFDAASGPIGAAVTACAGSDASIKVLVGATPYYIPLYDSLS